MTGDLGPLPDGFPVPWDSRGPDTPDAYDAPLSAIRNHADDLGVSLGIWSRRDDSRPDAHARLAANSAMDSVDAMLRELYALRSALVGEIRASDDATGRRVDAMLREPALKLRTDVRDLELAPGLKLATGVANLERGPGPVLRNGHAQLEARADAMLADEVRFHDGTALPPKEAGRG